MVLGRIQILVELEFKVLSTQNCACTRKTVWHAFYRERHENESPFAI